MMPARNIKMDGARLVEWQAQTSAGPLPRGDSPTILLGEKHVPWSKFGAVAVGDGSLYNGDYPESAARVGGPKHGLAQSIHDPYNANFGSYHPRLCQFLMADGSVKSFDTSVGADVLGKLTNRHP